jgi:hypothetical protein
LEPNSREEKRRIFRNELFTLREEGYLSDTVVETVARAHKQYHSDLLAMEEATEPLVIKVQEAKVTKAVKPPKVKKTLSPEEIRERNISWSLNIGVIFLLIGGLFVATSTWESMTSLMKSGSIAVVSLIFYGIAYLAKRVLKIDKTAFAFIVLGSLFLPIFILSLGWFGLLGPYLSIFGEGRYVLGMLGSILPIGVYTVFAKKLSARLFVWFSYISLSAGIAFMLASFRLKTDYFYLGMMGSTAILIYCFHYFKGKDAYRFFTKEFIPFVQVNLVLVTLFMLFFYENEVVYGFNLILTAVIYLSMMYVSGKKEYHFVFTAMIVYATYQLIENSFLDYFGEIVYAMVGFGLVFVPKLLNNQFSLNKVFQFTSAIISGFAFIYITFEGILLRADNPSIVLMLAYFIIAANFVYLSHNSPVKLFPYLSAVFAASGIFEAFALLLEPIESIDFTLTLFLTGFTLFLVLGIGLQVKFLAIIGTSSKDIGLASMILALLSALVFYQWWELGVMLLLFVSISYVWIKREKRVFFKEAGHWVLPSSLGFSLIAFGEEYLTSNRMFYVEYGNGVNFAAGALLVLLSSFIWGKFRNKVLSQTSIYVSVMIYSIAIVHGIIGPINQQWVQPLLFLIGIGVYYYLYKRIGTNWVPFFVSGGSILFYFSSIGAITLKWQFTETIESMIASTCAVLLLAIAYLFRKVDSRLSFAFAWTGHSVYPLALLFTLFFYHTEALYCFIIAVVAYAISTKITSSEWRIKAFLYGSFTSLFFVISTGLDQFYDTQGGLYEFPITTALIMLFTILVPNEFKKRAAYFIVPFSILGIACMLFSYPFDLLPYLVMIAITLVTVLYLHKSNWGILGILPLFLLFVATAQFLFLNDLAPIVKILLPGGIGVLLAVIGQILYKYLIQTGSKFSEINFDGYTAISFLFFILMYLFGNQALWTQALPGILIAGSLFMQKKRVPENLAVFTIVLGGVYLLQPYYAVINGLNIHPLWEREVQVLPFIILIIFIRRMLKGRYSQITKPIQWAVLIIVSLLLIQDGLASNTIYDAIIVGSLSLLSMIAGMFLQVKSYFFTGAGVLMLNVFLQTRPYWGNMPWWVYLLIAGFILITVASINEWHKQKILKGETTFITLLKEKIVDRVKQWD